MRLREFLLNTTLMFFTITPAKAEPLFNDGLPADVGNESNSTAESSVPALPAAPSALIPQDKVLASAYYDTLSILKTNNACSDFFGGPDASVEVFNQLVSRMRKDFFTPSTGMRMSGETINFFNARAGKEYRLFEQVSINGNGPFYRKQFSLFEPRIYRIGSFEPDTKEARVLMLLHELGHLIKGEDGKWLLPDDGRSAEISLNNSQKVEVVCSEQIHNLGKGQRKGGARIGTNRLRTPPSL